MAMALAKKHPEVRFAKEMETHDLLPAIAAEHPVELLVGGLPTAIGMPTPLGGRGGPEEGPRKGGSAFLREKELEGVTKALKAAVEILRKDNEGLRKLSHNNVRFITVIRKNEDLKKRIFELEAELDVAETGDGHGIARPFFDPQLRQSLIRRVAKLEEANASLRREVREGKEAREGLERAMEEGRRGSWRDARVKELEQSLEAERAANRGLRDELQRRIQAIGNLNRQLEKREDELDMVHGQSLINATGLGTLSKKLHKMTQRVLQLEAERDLKRGDSAHGGDTGLGRSREEVGRVEKLQREIQRLRDELVAFDPEIFEEIEDLKTDHHKLLQIWEDYGQMLRRYSQQLGLPFRSLGGPRP